MQYAQLKAERNSIILDQLIDSDFELLNEDKTSTQFRSYASKLLRRKYIFAAEKNRCLSNSLQTTKIACHVRH